MQYIHKSWLFAIRVQEAGENGFKTLFLQKGRYWSFWGLCRHTQHFQAQAKKSKKQRPKTKDQRPKPKNKDQKAKEQRAKSKEQRAKSKEQRAKKQKSKTQKSKTQKAKRETNSKFAPQEKLGK